MSASRVPSIGRVRRFRFGDPARGGKITGYMRKFRLRRGGEALYQRLGRKPPFDLAIIVVGFDALWRGAMLQGGAQAAPANRVMIEFLRRSAERAAKARTRFAVEHHVGDGSDLAVARR